MGWMELFYGALKMPDAVNNAPLLLDITNDQVLDASASGRFPDLFMVNGRDGEIIWSLVDQNPAENFLPCTFQTPIIIDDIDEDGVSDLLVIQSGLADQSRYISITNKNTGRVIVHQFERSDIESNVNDLLNETSDQALVFNICYEKKMQSA